MKNALHVFNDIFEYVVSLNTTQVYILFKIKLISRLRGENVNSIPGQELGNLNTVTCQTLIETFPEPPELNDALHI